MAVNRTTTDISDYVHSFTYAHGNNYLISSWSAGWTITGIDITARVTTVTSDQATNSSSWANSAVVDSPYVALSMVNSGATPASPNGANWSSSQWLYIGALAYDDRIFEVLPGSAQIGVNLSARVQLRYRRQFRLAAATDLYLQTYQGLTSAPQFSLEGVAETWAS